MNGELEITRHQSREKKKKKETKQIRSHRFISTSNHPKVSNTSNVGIYQYWELNIVFKHRFNQDFV